MKNFQIYITMDVESPDFDDFAQARSKLFELGINEMDENQKIGIMLTKTQWVNLKRNLSRFEMKMVSPFGLPNQIMGFPVKIVEFEVIQKL